ncbi:MAG TPA: hypothetical protein DDW49_00920, partial [Deltaproteobacteria bacterium]|nr:hypothetical protein [Deltaproteobacteria bacterium]
MAHLSKQVKDRFQQWGKQGGKARAARLSAKHRLAIAAKAAQARWGKSASTLSVHTSTRLSQSGWDDPVYLEEILSEGSLAAWGELYQKVSEHPFGPSAEALEKVLGSTEIYGV